ncbi:MAG: response regulator [Deltaproteobacteria bacterium]|nr:MAG: response regulator [Deltaproteobacteria bacterium]
MRRGRRAFASTRSPMVRYRNCAMRSHSPCERAGSRLARVAERREILVVDDDEDTRMVLQDLLELNGFAVRTSPDARRAIDAARAAPPALILVDYFMPDADGAWVVEQLRSAGLGQVPVVLTTGSNEGRQQAERLGVRSMEKPFDISRLLELVRSLVPGA